MDPPSSGNSNCALIHSLECFKNRLDERLLSANLRALTLVIAGVGSTVPICAQLSAQLNLWTYVFMNLAGTEGFFILPR